ncbi:MAG: hypothetical protein ACI8QC_003298 [Planctomycetota bacterium]|jgi:hypothetical protein
MGQLLPFILVAIGALQDPAPPASEGLPGPRRAVAGVRCVVARTRVIFEGLPERPHAMEWSLAYPGRGRSRLSADDGGKGARTLQYQYGARAWKMRPRSSESTLLTPEETLDARLEFALRRTIYAWPGAWEWIKGEGQWHANLGSIGKLRAEFGQGERPESVYALGPDGLVRSSLRELAWERRNERTWPVKASLWIADKQLWSEVLTYVDATHRFVDDYYLPPKERVQGSATPVTPLREITVPKLWIQQRPLPASDTPWQSPGSISDRRALQQSLAGTGWTLGPVPDLLLDVQGQPQGLRWTASGGPQAHSDAVLRAHGWLPSPDSRALATPIATVATIHPTVWREATRMANMEGRSTSPVLLRRRQGPDGPLPVELILPLRAQ